MVVSPSDDVAIWVNPVPPAFPIKMPSAVTEERPVPPRLDASVPVHPGVKVCALPLEVTRSVMFVSVEVANVWVLAVRPFSKVSPVPPLPQSVPVPLMTPFVSTCKHCVAPVIPESVSVPPRVTFPVTARVPPREVFPVIVSDEPEILVADTVPPERFVAVSLVALELDERPRV